MQRVAVGARALARSSRCHATSVAPRLYALRASVHVRATFQHASVISDVDYSISASDFTRLDPLPPAPGHRSHPLTPLRAAAHRPERPRPVPQRATPSPAAETSRTRPEGRHGLHRRPADLQLAAQRDLFPTNCRSARRVSGRARGGTRKRSNTCTSALALVSVDWSRRQPALWPTSGWQRVPPPVCPGCGAGWVRRATGRPTERNVACSCTTTRHHTVWCCPSCGAWVAEGCVDVTGWAGSTVGPGVPESRRWAVG